MSQFWILFELRTTAVVVTTGTTGCAKLQSNRHQQTNIHIFTGLMPFLSPNQYHQCQSTKGKKYHIPKTCSSQVHLGSPTLSLTTCSWLPWEGCHASHQPSDARTSEVTTVWCYRNSIIIIIITLRYITPSKISFQISTKRESASNIMYTNPLNKTIRKHTGSCAGLLLIRTPIPDGNLSCCSQLVSNRQNLSCT